MWERERDQDDDEFDEHDSEDLDDDRAAASPAVSIEVAGLSLYTRHGVSEAEREIGQRLVFDISFELDDCDATVTDRVEDTVELRARSASRWPWRRRSAPTGPSSGSAPPWPIA